MASPLSLESSLVGECTSSKESLGSSGWSALESLPAETAPTRASGFGVACFDMFLSDSKVTYAINIGAEYNDNVTALDGAMR